MLDGTHDETIMPVIIWSLGGLYNTQLKSTCNITGLSQTRKKLQKF